MPFNLPIFLTWLRILLIPLFIAVFYAPPTLLSPVEQNLLGASIFAVAAATVLAVTPAFGQQGEVGTGGVKGLVRDSSGTPVEGAQVSIAVVIIGREITISALREWMAQLGASRSVAVSFIGKLKTAAQMVSIVLLLYFEPVAGFDTNFFGTKLMWVAAVLTLWSMAYYLRMAWPQLKDHSY